MSYRKIVFNGNIYFINPMSTDEEVKKERIKKINMIQNNDIVDILITYESIEHRHIIFTYVYKALLLKDRLQ